MKILSRHTTDDFARRFWNRVFDSTPSFVNCYSTALRLTAEMALFHKYLPQPQGKRVLKIDLWDEVHNSGFLVRVAAEGAIVSGLDISDHIVTEASNNFAKSGLPGTLVVADMRYIPFSDNTFDLVWQIGTIEHVSDPSRVFLEVWRVLKPGGIAIMGCPNRHDPYGSQLVIKTLSLLGLWPYGEELSFSYADLKSFMLGAGFCVRERSAPYVLPWCLRYTDILLHLRAQPVDYILRPFIWPFKYINHIALFRKYANHIVCVGQK